MSETTTEIVTTSDSKAVEYTPLGSRDPIKLSTQLVRKFLAQKTKNGVEASDVECMKFVMLCKVRGLDPWQGDAYLLGYDGKDGPQFTLITAHQAFLKRAEINDKFDGMSSGVVCLDQNGQLLEYEGDLVLEDHTLIGGWARVLIKDRKLPIYKRLKLSTFNTGRSRWAADPAGMIVKCAEADALRSAFPTSLGGMYMAEETQSVIDIQSAPQRSSVPLSLTESKSPEKPQKAERKATTPPVETPVAPQPEQKYESPHQEPKREPEPTPQPETPPQSNGNGAPSLPKLQAIMDAGGYTWSHLSELCNTETEPGVFGRRKYIEGAQSLEELTEEQVAGLVARPRGLSAGLRAAKGAA